MRLITSILHSHNDSKLNAVFILFSIFLFPFIAIINYSFEIQNSFISQAFRLFNLIFALFIISKNFRNIFQIFQFDSFKEKSIVLFILFWVFYLIRIFIDLQYNNLGQLTSLSKNYYYLYSIGVTFIPLLAVITMYEVDYTFLEKILFNYLKIISCIFLVIFIIDKFFANHLVGRFAVTRNGFDYLDSISIAIYSSLLLFFSTINLKKSFYNYIFLFLSCFLLLSTAARGAIIFTTLTLLFTIIYRKFEFKINYWYVVSIVFLAGITNYVASLFFKNNFEGDNILLYRISHVASEDSNITRLKIVKDAFNQFLEHPFFGSHFLVIKSKMYAHNIILDSLISVGLIGSLLLIPIFFLFFKQLMNKSLHLFLATLGIFYFLNILTSGAFYNSPEFWIIFVLIINYKTNTQEKIRL